MLNSAKNAGAPIFIGFRASFPDFTDKILHPQKHIELPLNVRQNGGMLVPYTELEFKKEHVASVTISPTLKDKPVLPGLYVLRSELGMNFEIHRSQIPFRAM